MAQEVWDILSLIILTLMLVNIYGTMFILITKVLVFKKIILLGRCALTHIDLNPAVGKGLGMMRIWKTYHMMLAIMLGSLVLTQTIVRKMVR